MGLTKSNQELRRDLKDAASTLEDFTHELFRDAQPHGDAKLLASMERIAVLHRQIDRLRAYADEVKSGGIVRASE